MLDAAAPETVNQFNVAAPAPRPALASPCLAVFDLDGTLTWRDTLLPYLSGYAARHPSRWWRLWRGPAAMLDFCASHRDRGRLKSRLIQAVMGGDSRSRIEAWSDAFVAGLPRRRAFRPEALAVVEVHRAAGDPLVLLSASPDLYVPRIGLMLGFERTVCTELRWQHQGTREDRLDGTLCTPNRRGAEKTKCLAWLRTQYPSLPVVAYGNSDSDLPHLREADHAVLVNGNAKARRGARQSGITIADWN
jgi:phosphatidylglycerophosphatase C